MANTFRLHPAQNKHITRWCVMAVDTTQHIQYSKVRLKHEKSQAIPTSRLEIRIHN